MTTQEEARWVKYYNDVCPNKHTVADGNPFPAKGSPSYVAHKALFFAFLKCHDRLLRTALVRKIEKNIQKTDVQDKESMYFLRGMNQGLSVAIGIVGGKK